MIEALGFRFHIHVMPQLPVRRACSVACHGLDIAAVYFHLRRPFFSIAAADVSAAAAVFPVCSGSCPIAAAMFIARRRFFLCDGVFS